MDFYSFLIQLLNGVQYGLLLFLVASGLTLIFGIMGIINLAHGSFYMIGAYMAYALAPLTGSLFIAIVVGIMLLVGLPVHEFSHALVAYRLGDGTAKMFGRLSLNPVVHFDPVGGTLLALTFIYGVVHSFAWARLVRVSSAWYARVRTRRRAS